LRDRASMGGSILINDPWNRLLQNSKPLMRSKK
jgi:hypothetical protein